MDTGASVALGVLALAAMLSLPLYIGRIALNTINRASWTSDKEAKKKATEAGHRKVVWAARATALAAFALGLSAGIGFSHPGLYTGSHDRPCPPPTRERCELMRDFEESMGPGARIRPPPRSKKAR